MTMYIPLRDELRYNSMDASKITVSIPYAINLYFIFISLERNHYYL